MQQNGGNLSTSWEVSLSRYIMIDLNEFPWAAIITFFPDRSWGSICSLIWPQLDAKQWCLWTLKQRIWNILSDIRCNKQISGKLVWVGLCILDLWNKQQLFEHTFPSSRHWEVVCHNSDAIHELVPSHTYLQFPAYWDLAVLHT